MLKTTFRNGTKDITLEEAIDAYRYGIALEVNDGKDITVVIEKEPISPPAK